MRRSSAASRWDSPRPGGKSHTTIQRDEGDEIHGGASKQRRFRREVEVKRIEPLLRRVEPFLRRIEPLLRRPLVRQILEQRIRQPLVVEPLLRQPLLEQPVRKQPLLVEPQRIVRELAESLVLELGFLLEAQGRRQEGRAGARAPAAGAQDRQDDRPHGLSHRPQRGGRGQDGRRVP
jgi:hypothetical protein